MRNLISQLMRTTPVFVMAPPDMPGMGSFGGGTDQSGGGTQEGGGFESGSSQQGPLIGFDDEQDDDGLGDVLSAFVNEDDDDTGEVDDTGTNESGAFDDIAPERLQSMQTEVRNAIQNMRLPEAAIPADFDPNDRAQVQTLMNQTIQAAVAQSLNVVFKPVQLAMEHMRDRMNSQIETQIRESRDSSSAQNILESQVPEVNNPKYRGLVTSLDSTLKAKGKKPAERAKAIRKMLNQMGVTEGAGSGGNNRRASNPDGGGNQSIRTGKAALDSFFGSFPMQPRR